MSALGFIRVYIGCRLFGELRFRPLRPIKKKLYNVSGRSGRISRTAKARLWFPVSRMHRYICRGKYSERIAAGAPVYLAAVPEYLVAEVLELRGNAARERKKRRINPRVIGSLLKAMKNSVSQLTPRMIVPSGRVLPSFHSVMLQKKKRKYTKKTSEQNGRFYARDVKVV